MMPLLQLLSPRNCPPGGPPAGAVLTGADADQGLEQGQMKLIVTACSFTGMTMAVSMVVNFTFDHITLLLVVFIFIPFFTWRGILAFEEGRYGKFGYCSILALFVLRLAYLRVSTNGGQVGFYDSSTLQFTKELGDPAIFFILTLLLLLSAIHRMADDDRFYRKNYIKREDFEKELAKRIAALKPPAQLTQEQQSDAG